MSLSKFFLYVESFKIEFNLGCHQSCLKYYISELLFIFGHLFIVFGIYVVFNDIWLLKKNWKREMCRLSHSLFFTTLARILFYIILSKNSLKIINSNIVNTNLNYITNILYFIILFILTILFFICSLIKFTYKDLMQNIIVLIFDFTIWKYLYFSVISSFINVKELFLLKKFFSEEKNLILILSVFFLLAFRMIFYFIRTIYNNYLRDYINIDDKILIIQNLIGSNIN